MGEKQLNCKKCWLRTRYTMLHPCYPVVVPTLRELGQGNKPTHLKKVTLVKENPRRGVMLCCQAVVAYLIAEMSTDREAIDCSTSQPVYIYCHFFPSTLHQYFNHHHSFFYCMKRYFICSSASQQYLLLQIESSNTAAALYRCTTIYIFLLSSSINTLGLKNKNN